MHNRVFGATRAGLLVLALLIPAVAFAHGVLLGSSPAANSNLVVVPGEVRLIFNERPERAFTRVALMSPAGVAVPLDTLTFGPGNVATARIRGPLVAGVYTVMWQTVGRDGHPVNGSFTFAIAPDAVGVASPVVDTGAAAAPPVRPASFADRAAELAPFATLLRWLTLIGIIAAVGAVAFRMIVVRRLALDMPHDMASVYIRPLLSGSAMLGLWAAAVLAVSALVRLMVQVLATDALGSGGGVSTLLLTTTWGRGWMLHLAGTLIAAVGFVGVRRARMRSWALAGTGAILATTGLALSGHAVSESSWVGLTVLGHILHAVAAASWLGTLLLIATVALPLSFRLDRDDRWRVVADIVQAFSPVALAFAGITVLAGVLIAWSHLQVLQALWLTEYGRVLLVKLALVGLTAAAGAYNWLRVRPTLGELPGARRLRRSASVELALAALVLAVTAVLVATPLPAR